TPAARAFSFDSATSRGLISIPTPRAPYFVAAAITIRPSPEPRSYTVSALVTFAAVSIASTTSGGVATKRTLGTCASATRVTRAGETASATNAATMSPIFPIDTAIIFAQGINSGTLFAGHGPRRHRGTENSSLRALLVEADVSFPSSPAPQ